MAKKYLLPASIFLSGFIIFLALGIGLNAMIRVLRNGDMIDEGYNGSISTLTGFKQQQGTGENYYIDLQGRCDPSGLALISMYYAPDAIYVNGMKTEFLTHGSISGRILIAEIPAEAFIYGEDGTWSVHIELFGISEDELDRMSLCSMGTAITTVYIYNIVMPVIYGMLFTISLYGLLLYLSKRDKMLLLFSLYTFCTFLWSFSACLVYHFGIDNMILKLINTYIFEFAVVLGIATCISFCEFQFKTGWNWLGKWYTLLALCTVYSIVSSRLTPLAGSELLFVAYTVGAVLLVVACGQSERKPWIALFGLSITQALRFIVLQYDSSQYPLSFYFELMKLMRLFIIPYVVGCMIYINSTFATKFREAEELAGELEQSNKLLDKKVEDRTRELTEQQQIRTNLLTNIFHDLRSPLLIMRGCTDRLKNERKYDEETVHILDERLSFITEMTEELFSTVKLEDKSLILETEPVYLKPVLRKIVDACQMEANKKGVQIECYCETNAVAWGDETWLSRAFQNLIANAIYYSKPGGGNVTVTMQVVSGQIEVYVSDRGVGIAPEDQDKIFDRYTRISGTKKHKSSGLGLSIAAGVIAHHNGSIAVESYVGEGTTFLVKLPLWSTEPN